MKTEQLEESVIGGAMLWEGRWPCEVFDVEPAYFTSQRRAQIWMAVQELIGSNKPVDEITVSAVLVRWGVTGSAVYLSDVVQNTPSSVTLPEWCKLLVDEGTHREATNAVREVMQQCEKEHSNPSEIAAAVTDAIAKIHQRTTVDAPKRVSALMRSVTAELEDEHNNPEASRIAWTGLVNVDKLVKMRRGDLTIVAGRPAMGKTAFAGNIAQRCGRNPNQGCVVVFSLEMRANDLIRRMISSEANLPERQLPRLQASGDLVEACATVHGLDIYIDDTCGIDINALRAKCVRVRKQIRLVVFDFLQLAKMKETKDNLSERLGQVARELKNIAKDFDAHVVALSQLNRQVDNRPNPRPMLSDLKGSGGLEEAADVVLGLYRPHYYNASEPEDEAEIICMKQRKGPTGIVTVKWTPATQTFSNL